MAPVPIWTAPLLGELVGGRTPRDGNKFDAKPCLCRKGPSKDWNKDYTQVGSLELKLILSSYFPAFRGTLGLCLAS
jgi:hypothetical protein